jgi:hypothetical protein
VIATKLMLLNAQRDHLIQVQNVTKISNLILSILLT